MNGYKILVIGTSAGGFEALSMLLPHLPADYPLAIAVVQHQKHYSDSYLLEHLQKKCRLPVQQAEDKCPIEPAKIYLAAPDYHLAVEPDKTFSLLLDEPENHARPAVDVLFQTAAEAYGNQTVGVLLTGAGNDGTCGVRAILNNGGTVIVQDPVEAEVPSMPQNALRNSIECEVLRLWDIRQRLLTIDGYEFACERADSLLQQADGPYE